MKMKLTNRFTKKRGNELQNPKDIPTGQNKTQDSAKHIFNGRNYN